LYEHKSNFEQHDVLGRSCWMRLAIRICLCGIQGLNPVAEFLLGSLAAMADYALNRSISAVEFRVSIAEYACYRDIISVLYT
jgi:hypothetical protein